MDNQHVHRRVQKKIAKEYLQHIDPDGAIVKEFFPDRLTEFKSIDSETKKKFDEQHRQFKKSESAYSIQNVCWLIAAFGVFYYTDFYRAILYDRRIMRFWLNTGVILVGINLCIALFLIVYLSFVKKMHSDEWDKRFPAAIPIATAAFVLGGIFITIGLWPVWGPFTPAILLVFFMAFIVTIAMLPNF